MWRPEGVDKMDGAGRDAGENRPPLTFRWIVAKAGEIAL